MEFAKANVEFCILYPETAGTVDADVSGAVHERSICDVDTPVAERLVGASVTLPTT